MADSWEKDNSTSVSVTINESTVEELQQGFPSAIDLAEAVRMAVETGLEERRRERLRSEEQILEEIAHRQAGESYKDG